jgi:hypothetical protein
VTACVGTELSPEQVSTAPSNHAHTRPNDGLPDKMDTAQIKQGLDRLRPGIVACGTAAGLSGGKLRIQFAVEGRTGQVIQDELLEKHDADLAQCVHEGIQAMQTDGTSVFPTFEAERQRFSFNFAIR